MCITANCQCRSVPLESASEDSTIKLFIYQRVAFKNRIVEKLIYENLKTEKYDLCGHFEEDYFEAEWSIYEMLERDFLGNVFEKQEESN